MSPRWTLEGTHTVRTAEPPFRTVATFAEPDDAHRAVRLVNAEEPPTGIAGHRGLYDLRGCTASPAVWQALHEARRERDDARRERDKVRAANREAHEALREAREERDRARADLGLNAAQTNAAPDTEPHAPEGYTYTWPDSYAPELRTTIPRLVDQYGAAGVKGSVDAYAAHAAALPTAEDSHVNLGGQRFTPSQWEVIKAYAPGLFGLERHVIHTGEEDA